MVLRKILVASQYESPLGGIIQTWTLNTVAGESRWITPRRFTLGSKITNFIY